MLRADQAALVLAPMDGVTEAPMRSLQGELGGFTFCVSEFVRVSHEVVQAKAFLREVPELAHGARTATGLPVQVQLLGGDPERMAASAQVAVTTGATAVDINFGCPAPTVNRHDGGATLLRSPCRIREVVAAVRRAVPAGVPVSAKLRLGWDDIQDIHLNARMAAEGGADWLTIHARTRSQGYAPPVYWEPIGEVRRALNIPVVANGDIWTLEDFRRCREVTGCRHFMLGRSALADPRLPGLVAGELGLEAPVQALDWPALLRGLVRHSQGLPPSGTLTRLKQWIRIASRYGRFAHFDRLKRSTSLDEFFAILDDC
ncbi:MAG: tRNA-dihydrouridine synthase family protein [Vulcanimicrobiota bacterium]